MITKYKTYSTRLLTVMAIILTVISGCTREDDVDLIFEGRTYYMNGGTINGLRMNSDVKQFYTDAKTGAYYISFHGRTFHGMLRVDTPMSGTWTVNGRDNTISLQFDQRPATKTDFDSQLYNILKSVTSYDSGGTFLILKEDKDNFIMFGTKR